MKELEAKMAALMKKSREGDAVAYRELLVLARDTLRAYFARHLGRVGVSDAAFADDLVQEALVALHVKRDTYDAAQLFTPWMYAIARYKLVDLVRARKNLRLHDDVELIDELAEALPERDAGAAHDVEALLRQLPERQRQAVELTKLKGLSVAETASKLGMSVVAVKVSVHRAIKTLKKLGERP